jgi:hypothetical protein
VIVRNYNGAKGAIRAFVTGMPENGPPTQKSELILHPASADPTFYYNLDWIPPYGSVMLRIQDGKSALIPIELQFGNGEVWTYQAILKPLQPTVYSIDMGAFHYSVAGRVTGPNSAGLAGVKVSLSPLNLDVFTNANGDYTFGKIVAGDYTVVPTLAGYDFVPASAPVHLTGDTTANFSGFPVTITKKISGKVTLGGAALSSVSVVLSGDGSGTNTTATDGTYSFSNLPTGKNYTVTPALAGYSFTPSSQPFTNLQIDQTADFIATRLNYTITGKVAANGGGLQSAIVSLTGGKNDSTLTDTNGNFTFSNLPGGASYTVTFGKTGYTFTPPSVSIPSLTKDERADTTATILYTISGQATKSGSALAGVTMTLTGGPGGTRTTDTSGNYSFTSLPAGGNYIITPSLAGHTFNPASSPINNLQSNQTANFTATPVVTTGSISGQVVKSGVALPGVTITLAGGSGGTAVTDSSGNYSFAALPAGANYTITPSLANHTFAPANYAVSNLQGTFTASFTASSTGTSANWLVFLKAQDAWAIKTDGTGLRQLTSYGDLAGLPRLANGTLVYRRSEQLYSRAFEGGTPTAIPNASGVQEFDLDSTGAKLLLTHSGDSGGGYANQVLYTMNLDGSGKVAINTLASQHNAMPTFGRDGYIYLDQSNVGDAYSHKVYRIPTTGTNNSTQLVTFFSQFATPGFNNRVLFYGNTDNTNDPLPLYVMNANGSGQVQIPNATMDYMTSWPAFDYSADVAYYIQSGTLYRINLDGSGKVALTTGIDVYSGVDFGLTPIQGFGIAGKVLKNGSALAGVTMTLTGASGGTRTTDASGAYSFDALPAGGSYTVTPSFANHTFSPASAPFNNLQSSQTADFTATLITFNISGQVTKSGSGLAGVTITLTGGPGGTRTTDTSGNYAFTGLPSGGNYTLTPSLTNYTFSPSSLPINNLLANQTANFTAALGAAPTSVSVSPNSGTGGKQIFQFKSSDPNGAGDIYYAQFNFSNPMGAVNSCYIHHDPATNAFYLLNDDASGWFGLIGGTGKVSNSQCLLDGVGTGSTKSGNDLTTTLNLSFRSSFTGSKNVYLYTADKEDNATGWVQIGTWTPTGNNNLTEVVSVLPNSGSASSQVFTLRLRDGDGAANIWWNQISINAGLNGYNGCYIHHDPANNVFYLLNDAATEWYGLFGATAGVVQNSQCILRGSGSTRALSGTDLVVTYDLQFKTDFKGVKDIYVQGSDLQGNMQPWKRMGGWTVP